MSKGTVLVIGDFIIDRTWLVGEPSLAEQHNSHYEIHPRNLVEPEREPDVAGGVGTAARALAAISEDLDIVVVGAWSDYAEAEMVNRLIPPDGDPSIKKPSRIEFRRLVATGFTNLKSRFYLPVLDGARLTYRFDRNSDTVKEKGKQPKQDAIKWPSPNEVRLVIVGDYGYGLLHARGLVERVKTYARHADVILRSFNRAIIQAYPWNFLTLNLHLFARYIGREAGFDSPITKQVNDLCRYHPLLVEALDSVEALKDHPRAAMLVNLEKEGALLIQNAEITPYILSSAVEGLNTGIGVNDIVLAHIAKGLLAAKGDFDERLKCSVGPAVRAGSFFGARARQLTTIPGWYAPKLTVTDEEIGRSTPLLKRSSTSLPKAPDVLHEISAATEKSETFIQLHDAGWYLDGYLTVDSTLGAEIMALRAKIEDSVRSRRERPFVAVLCGDPGAGKTTLAQRLGQVTGCAVILDNAAQWASVDQLSGTCERIRTARMQTRVPLAFIDEVDSMLQGQHVYGKLLSPIWDGAYYVNAEERSLGFPTIFLLAGSSAPWRTRTALLEQARKDDNDKLADLVSRLSALPVNITPLADRKADIVYMTAAHIVRKFPRVQAAQRGIFRLFTESTLRHGARSIAALVDLFRQPRDERRLATDDLMRKEDLPLHIDSEAKNWQNDNKVTIGIRP